jgi:autotransporter-associated beta strand protein
MNGDWSNPANWSGGAPAHGASLVFPAGVSSLDAVNDLAAGTTFVSIEIDAPGYALSGNAIALSQGITTTYSSGVTSDAIDTQLGGPVSVAPGGELDLNGALTSSVGLTVAGGGKVVLGGSSANTYTGSTTVDGSTLVLGKSGRAVAVPGNLVIGDGISAATVHATAANQTASTTDVTVNDHSTFYLNGNNDTIGTLTLTGATVTTGAGMLTLGGDVTANDAATEDVSSISGNLDLGGAARTFTVSEPTPDTTPDIDLSVPAVISDSTAGITFTGGGQVALSGNNTYTGLTTVVGSGTTLLVDGTVGAVGLEAGTTLGGSGTVGDVSSTGGRHHPRRWQRPPEYGRPGPGRRLDLRHATQWARVERLRAGCCHRCSHPGRDAGCHARHQLQPGRRRPDHDHPRPERFERHRDLQRPPRGE